MCTGLAAAGVWLRTLFCIRSSGAMAAAFSLAIPEAMDSQTLSLSPLAPWSHL